MSLPFCRRVARAEVGGQRTRGATPPLRSHMISGTQGGQPDVMDFNADDAIIPCFEGVTMPVADYIKNKRITDLTLREIVALQTEHG